MPRLLRTFRLGHRVVIQKRMLTVPELVEQYLPEYHRRHAVRPGVTGLAQVNGRASLTYEESMLYDLEYVDHHSLLGDVVILAKTLPAVLSRRGAR